MGESSSKRERELFKLYSLFSYTLPNGTHRDELGELLNANSTPEEIRNANNYARNARPSRRPGVKNRKLSPKSLSSLAG